MHERVRARVRTHTHIYTPFKRKVWQEIINIPNLLANALYKLYVMQGNEFRRENFTSFLFFMEKGGNFLHFSRMTVQYWPDRIILH
jgi:hypothetical protein